MDDVATATAAKNSSVLVRMGDWVVLETTDGKRVLGHVVPGSTARLGKRKRPIIALLGCRWGDVFTVRDGQGSCLVRVEDELCGMQAAPALTVVGTEDDVVNSRDNRFLRDSFTNQELNQDDIERMKSDGVAGRSMVDAVVKHSTTFVDKTPFAQDKYVERKLRKYDLRVRVVRPTALTICETYFSKSPERTLYMRPDALGLLLGYSGARAGCRALVFADSGLVTGAVSERMGGMGQLLNVFTGTTPPGAEMFKIMNLSESEVSTVLQTPLEVFGKLNDDEQPADAERIRYGPTAMSMGDAEPSSEVFETSERRLTSLAQRPTRGTLKRLIRGKADVLVVATRLDVIPVFDVLLRHLAPSGTFAVYSTFLASLSELQFALQLSKMACRVELMETTVVQHQVLPGRTHPYMSDSATGGYVLWGVRISVAPPL
jgi:tRNA (adenine58-N1)-methyltransferase non-catalytic subunit